MTGIPTSTSLKTRRARFAIVVVAARTSTIFEGIVAIGRCRRAYEHFFRVELILPGWSRKSLGTPPANLSPTASISST